MESKARRKRTVVCRHTDRDLLLPSNETLAGQWERDDVCCSKCRMSSFPPEGAIG